LTLTQQLTDKFPITRQKAAFSLAGSNDPRVIAPLAAALQDKEESVRQAAAYALGRQGTAGVSPLLAALDAPEAGVRAAAAGGLSYGRDPRAL
jgi:HEAT repeat protein